ncbi:MAG: potassium-transporting ATPase subunit KdpC [Gemmataceae bacterium]
MKLFATALRLFVCLSVLTGVVYPLVVTSVAQVVFPHQANGSLVVHHERVVGSELIGQPFDDPRYFWGRPSATNPEYDASSSSGSNLGPTNDDLTKRIKGRAEALRAAHPEQTSAVPVDLVTTSASGLDPHISPAAAEYQVLRVARTRNMAPERIRALVSECTEGRTLTLLGEPRVNVLQLNLALDGLDGGRR